MIRTISTHLLAATCSAVLAFTTATGAIAKDMQKICNQAETSSEPAALVLALIKAPAQQLELTVGAPKAFLGSVDRLIRDVDFNGSPGDSAIRVQKLRGENVRLEHIRIQDAQLGISLRRTNEAVIYDMTFRGVSPKTIYGAAIRVGGKRDKRTTGPTIVQRVLADGEDAPLETYKESNTDFLTSEPGSAPVYIRDVTAKGFSDAMIDNKSTIYVSNATLTGGHRVLRAHRGAKIVIANSIVNSDEGRALIWMKGPEGSVQYFNTLWNGAPNPDPSLVKTDTKDFTSTDAMNRIVQLDHNPLPEEHSIFGASPTDLAFARSIAGAVWEPVPVDGLVYGPIGLVGDLRVRIPNPDQDARYCLLAEFGDGRSDYAGIWHFDAENATLSKLSAE